MHFRKAAAAANSIWEVARTPVLLYSSEVLLYSYKVLLYSYEVVLYWYKVVPVQL